MLTSIRSAILSFLNSRWFWLSILLISLLGEACALFYQHVLGYGPCMVCIQIRLWLLLIIFLSLIILCLPQTRLANIIGSLAGIGLTAGMLERSWFILGTERGFSFGSCSFNLGLPEWLALDKWFPPLFEVVELCGLTPVLVFNITMAEALVVNAVGFLIAFIARLFSAFFTQEK